MKNKNNGFTFKPKISEGAELLVLGARQRSQDYTNSIMLIHSASGDEASLKHAGAGSFNI